MSNTITQHTNANMIASQPYINFLPRHHYAHLLGLLPGDLDTFSEVIYLISEYEGMYILSLPPHLLEGLYLVSNANMNTI